MAEENPDPQAGLGSATYDVIRRRLSTAAETLRARMDAVDARRREVFGSVGFELLRAERVNTAHNCIPQDMVQLGDGRFLFGFNVQFGLKKETDLADVFAVYQMDGESFREETLEVIGDPRFLSDFRRIYTVYEKTVFAKFSVVGAALFMVFRTGAGANDIAVFKWTFEKGALRYVDGRSEAEFRRDAYPPQYHFRWLVPDRESYRYGDHPHVSIAERVFVECVGGNLTIKVEDNTKTGEGVYEEPVDDKRQKVDDSEIAYAILGHLILLRIRPYKERAHRYLVFNEKTQSAVRIDSIGESCAALPEDQGIIFPDGFYLATGELKRFGAAAGDHTLERIVASPNGEDTLFVFYSVTQGEYILLPYRLISQKVEERIVCNGFTLFPNGHLVQFRADPEPQKHHMIQVRRTPFYETGFEPPGDRSSFLYQVGNRDVVRALAESNEVLTLVHREKPYAELYADVEKRCAGILDGFPWIANPEAAGLDVAVREVRTVAGQAIEEFDKVQRLQREAGVRLSGIRREISDKFNDLRRASFKVLDDYVRHLAGLRSLTGALVTLKDVRYIDIAALDALGTEVSTEYDRLSSTCVDFLLRPEALDPARARADELLTAAGAVAKVADARKLEADISEAASGLEMLIEIVNNLKIDDATETTRIIDAVTAVYTILNQARAALKNRVQSLSAAEGAARFAAQMKLLGQSAASFLDLCDSPDKCDEYLNRVSVQIEELEGTFAEFDDYLVQIADRRTELYEAFEQRKLALVEARNRRTAALLTSAGRILKVIENRLNGFSKVEEINTYLASDVMVSKVRDTVGQLLEAGDSVKADDLATRLKALGQQSIRQLKDRQDLFAGGPGVIRLGRHDFNVNTQPLDLTIVLREDKQFIHLTGTRYFDAIDSEEFLATSDVWDQEFVSENRTVYRAETLARRLLDEVQSNPETSAARVTQWADEQRLEWVRQFMAPQYEEGYTRGVHDLDGARIFAALLEAHTSLELARYHPSARALAIVFWHDGCPADARDFWAARLRGFSERNRVFTADPLQAGYVAELRTLLEKFAGTAGLFAADLAPVAAEYLFYELTSNETFACTREADGIVAAFRQRLATKGGENAFAAAKSALAGHSTARFEIIRDWLRGFLVGEPALHPYLDEAAAVIFCGDRLERRVVTGKVRGDLEGLKGSHPLLVDGRYTFDYLSFRDRLDAFESHVVPIFRRYHALKQAILERERRALRLNEFRPNVLSSFVRNQLIDEVYLPLIGDNLTKQIGAAGDNKRTDRSGLLLLLSPPGYGKTTLLEYIASRLGIVFVKINGPALGHNTCSLDPEEAPNAAAREEVQKLNLALEMGDNLLLCVDDIQHCSAEFLQKFISLCDAQRKIEGVWRGQSRTYDLRGRKVAVAMAGNPYTETGKKFRLPDMLANRADTYNLGDIGGGQAAAFKASYIENAVTSNAILAPLANRSQKDIRTFLRLAETGGTPEFEGSYSAQETNEIVSILKKLVAIRDAILTVNLEYIRSAAQSDEFRTEPAFKLQGSYRNMNRLAEKVVPVMNDDEVHALILDHYRNESQTLTADAEANLLKLRELLGVLTPAESKRWDEIRSTFRRNQLTRGTGDDDPAGRIVGQLSAFGAGLENIQRTLADGLEKAAADRDAALTTDLTGRMRSVTHELEMIHATLATLRDSARQQRDFLQSAREQLALRAKQGVLEFDLTDEMLTNEQDFLDRIQSLLATRLQTPDAPPRKADDAPPGVT